MWKARPDDKSAGAAPSAPTGAAPQLFSPAVSSGSAAPAAPRPAAPPRPAENFRSEVAHIGKSVLIRGELSGSEDLYLDGEVEGNIELKQHSLTVGPHGRVRANVHAREVVVHGKVDGNITGDERVELKKSAILAGDISTQRIVIEDGAYFKGAIDIQKESGSGRGAGERREVALSAAPAISSGGSSAFEPHPALAEKKY